MHTYRIHAILTPPSFIFLHQVQDMNKVFHHVVVILQKQLEAFMVFSQTLKYYVGFPPPMHFDLNQFWLPVVAICVGVEGVFACFRNGTVGSIVGQS